MEAVARPRARPRASRRASPSTTLVDQMGARRSGTLAMPSFAVVLMGNVVQLPLASATAAKELDVEVQRCNEWSVRLPQLEFHMHDVPAGKELDPVAWRDSAWMVLLRREHEFAVHAFGFGRMARLW